MQNIQDFVQSQLRERVELVTDQSGRKVPALPDWAATLVALRAVAHKLREQSDYYSNPIDGMTDYEKELARSVGVGLRHQAEEVEALADSRSV